MFGRLKKQAKRLTIKKSFIGVDIGFHDIKIAEVYRDRLWKLGRISTPEGALDDGSVIQLDIMADAIKKLLVQLQIKNKRTVTVVTGKNVIVRYIKMPRMSAQEVASALKWEAERYIPLCSGADMLVDFMILGDYGETAQQDINVMIAAVPRRLVYLLHEVFQLAGLDLIAVEIPPVSIWRSVGKRASQSCNQVKERYDTVICADIGAKSTNLIFFHDGNLIFSRYIPLGGDLVTTSLASELNIEFSAAQEIKEREGENSDFEQIIKSGIEPLIEEIKRSIEFFRFEFKIFKPGVLVLTGGTSKQKGIAEYIRNEISLTVILGIQEIMAQEWLQLSKDSCLGFLDPSFTVVAGLAMRKEL